MSEVAVDFLLGPDWSSTIIARYGTPVGGYSHCASVLSDGRYLDARSDALRRVDPNCKVPETVPPGVHIRDPQSERWVRKRRVTLQVTQAEYNDWEADLRAKITSPYGRTDIVGFFPWGRPGHVAGQWICSALMINAVQHIGRAWVSSTLAVDAMRHVGLVPFPLPVPAHQISPNSALLILATAGFTIGPEVTQ
jgi:hypothetical protein